ncbi:MAG TPA: ABC transporter ATP-binding protein [Candidatus Paceibacterota bacterium]|nr:ABC transporter ATP-binding protein [Candidatus Paceibacterota bacterium]
MLNVQSLSKSFGDLDAVKGVSFEVKDGEVFCLIGPNGAGKTTIIKSIAGLLRPDGGTVTVGGKDVVTSPRETKAMIGYIPDDPSAWPGMTGEQFLHFVGSLFDVPEAERMEAVRDLLGTFRLEGIEKHYFETYSRGNKQKFSILAALLHKPKLLLVDEPIVGLDPLSARTAKGLFTKFAGEGGHAALIATHTLSFAQEIATRIGIMSRGRLAAVGTMDELRAQAHCAHDASLEDVYVAIAERS